MEQPRGPHTLSSEESEEPLDPAPSHSAESPHVPPSRSRASEDPMQSPVVLSSPPGLPGPGAGTHRWEQGHGPGPWGLRIWERGRCGNLSGLRVWASLPALIPAHEDRPKGKWLSARGHQRPLEGEGGGAGLPERPPQGPGCVPWRPQGHGCGEAGTPLPGQWLLAGSLDLPCRLELLALGRG